jgi:hypothetical protein
VHFFLVQAHGIGMETVLITCAANTVMFVVADITAQKLELRASTCEVTSETADSVPEAETAEASQARTLTDDVEAVERDDGMNWRRTARFSIVGGFVSTPLMYLRYAVVGQLFPSTTASGSVAIQKTLFNQLVFDPPDTLAQMAFLEHLRTNGDLDSVVDKLRSDYWNVQVPAWCVSIPVNVATFYFFHGAVWQQVIFQKTVSTGFHVYFSHVANRPPPAPMPAEGKLEECARDGGEPMGKEGQEDGESLCSEPAAAGSDSAKSAERKKHRGRCCGMPLWNPFRALALALRDPKATKSEPQRSS